MSNQPTANTNHMKRNPRMPKAEWKKLSKKAKRDQKTAKKENWKCSGKKICHGMRSSVAKTWDSSKGSVRAVKTTKSSEIPADRLDAIAKRLADAQGWSYEWVRSQPAAKIFSMARKNL